MNSEQKPAHFALNAYLSSKKKIFQENTAHSLRERETERERQRERDLKH